MSYGIRPWEMEGLTRSEWVAICDDHKQREAAMEEAI